MFRKEKKILEIEKIENGKIKNTNFFFFFENRISFSSSVVIFNILSKFCFVYQILMKKFFFIFPFMHYLNSLLNFNQF